MREYIDVCYELSEVLTLRYSTSFGMSSKLFPEPIRKHIYAIYGLVRVADEVVDTYRGADAPQRLDALEQETYLALQTGYSPNPMVQAFACTARAYGIEATLVAPFFTSMRTDLTRTAFDAEGYAAYIYGSAEVVGLMCLKVFVGGDEARYRELEDGARALGSAYQMVNFLRDLRADQEALGRFYFPDADFASFDEAAKQRVVATVEQQFLVARAAIDELPASCRTAVATSYAYYWRLLQKIKRTPAGQLKRTRVRVGDGTKVVLYAGARLSTLLTR